jgi:hypothetical protein
MANIKNPRKVEEKVEAKAEKATSGIVDKIKEIFKK